MKCASAALLLVACAPAIERAPATAQTKSSTAPKIASATPAPRPPLELSFNPSRIFAGSEPNDEHAEGTLFMVIDEGAHARRLDELDIATAHVFRSLDLGSDDVAAFEKRGDVLYAVTVRISPKVGATHTLHRVDLGSLKIVRSAKAAGAVPLQHTDHAFPSFVSVGSRGVRVVYRDFCPESIPEEEREGTCVYYETHRLDDLGVVKVHIVPLVRLYTSSPMHVPDDYGELPPEPSRDKDPRCKTNGMLFIDGVWVGDDYFELQSGCCDEPGGGFFECKATK